MSDRLLVRRRARLIYRVTDEFRSRLVSELQGRLERAESALAAVESALDGAGEGLGQLQARQAKLVKALDETRGRLRQAEALGLGDEVSEGAVEVVTDVGVGDDASRLGDAEIVIVDGRIEEVRNG